MSKQKEFIKLISNDEKEYFLDKFIANQCFFLEDKIKKLEKGVQVDFPTIIIPEIKGDVLEIVIQYLHYKSKYIAYPLHLVPTFNIQPDAALDVLNASLFLKL